MDPPIPLKGVVLFIAFGTMVFIIVFIFVKRQITRFTLRSSHGPHAQIGLDAPKWLSMEIDRRLKRVKDIVHEPELLNPEVELTLSAAVAADPHHFVYRMKAVDGLALLDDELKKCRPSVVRNPATPLKEFLQDQRLNGVLEGTKLDLIEKFASGYDHARHDPKNFSQADYQQFIDLRNHLLVHLRSRHTSVHYKESNLLQYSSQRVDILKLDKIY